MDSRTPRVKRERSQSQSEEVLEEVMPLTKKLTRLCLSQIPREETSESEPSLGRLGGVDQNNVDSMTSFGQSSGVGGAAYGQSDGDNIGNNFGHQIQASNDIGYEDVDMSSSSQEIMNGGQTQVQDHLGATLIQDGFERITLNNLMAENQFCLGEPRICQTSSLLHYEYPIIYEPTLNELENPTYFEQNRQLFYLYLERVHRYNMCPHSYIIRMRRERER